MRIKGGKGVLGKLSPMQCQNVILARKVKSGVDPKLAKLIPNFKPLLVGSVGRYFLVDYEIGFRRVQGGGCKE